MADAALQAQAAQNLQLCSTAIPYSALPCPAPTAVQVTILTENCAPLSRATRAASLCRESCRLSPLRL